jgi:hypothetical protein
MIMMDLMPSIYPVVIYGDLILSFITSRSDWYWVHQRALLLPQSIPHINVVVSVKTQAEHSLKTFIHGSVLDVFCFLNTTVCIGNLGSNWRQVA